MTGTDGGIRPTPSAVFGQAFATAPLTLTSAPLGSWLPVQGCEITLPAAGTYKVGAEVSAQVTQQGPATQAQVINLRARLFDVTAGAPVPNGDQTILAYNHNGAGLSLVVGCAPITRFVTVTGPTTIRLEGLINQQGADTRADPCRIFNLRTDIRYERIGS